MEKEKLTVEKTNKEHRTITLLLTREIKDTINYLAITKRRSRNQVCQFLLEMGIATYNNSPDKPEWLG